MPQGGVDPICGGDRGHGARDEDERRRGQGRSGGENVDAVLRGCPNLGRHIANVKGFGVPVVVAINHFFSDTEAELRGREGLCGRAGCRGDLCAAIGPKARRD
jgi:formyltetrahydrofolate synthetase